MMSEIYSTFSTFWKKMHFLFNNTNCNIIVYITHTVPYHYHIGTRASQLHKVNDFCSLNLWKFLEFFIWIFLQRIFYGVILFSIKNSDKIFKSLRGFLTFKNSTCLNKLYMLEQPKTGLLADFLGKPKIGLNISLAFSRSSLGSKGAFVKSRVLK